MDEETTIQHACKEFEENVMPKRGPLTRTQSLELFYEEIKTRTFESKTTCSSSPTPLTIDNTEAEKEFSETQNRIENATNEKEKIEVFLPFSSSPAPLTIGINTKEEPSTRIPKLKTQGSVENFFTEIAQKTPQDFWVFINK